MARTGDSPKQHRFRMWLRAMLYEGYTPTPTQCLRWLGKKVERTKYAVGGPSLSGHYTEIRIQEFKRAGLVKVNGRWRSPDGT